MSITVEFNPPLSVNNRSISSIVVNEPTLGQLMQAQKVGGSNGLLIMNSLIAECSGETLQVVALFPMTQFYLASDYIEPFLSSPAKSAPIS